MATGEEPELLLSNHGDIFFRPSCIHMAVSRAYEVKNVGRSALRFKWVISKEDSPNLTVDQEEGCILPNQTLVSAFNRRYQHYFVSAY